MELRYLGLSSFLIKTPKITFLTDPFDAKEVGVKMPKVEADVVVYTGEYKSAAKVTKSLVSVSEERKSRKFGLIEIAEPGEYEIGDVFVRYYDDPDFCVFTYDDMSICYCGLMSGVIQDSDFSDIGDIDYLIVPVGDSDSYVELKVVDKLIKEIDPAVVVPSCYKMDGMKGAYEQLKVLDEFLGMSGLSEVEPVKKLKLSAISRGEDSKYNIVVLSKQK